MNVVYISNSLANNGTGGGVVSNANLNLLKKCKIFKSVSVIDFEQANDCEFESAIFKKAITFILSVFKFSGGLTPKIIDFIINSQKVSNSDFIWIDSSLYGRLSESIKKRHPEKKIITFFHNVEFDFLSSLGEKRGFLYRSITKSGRINEFKSIINSDLVVTLSQNDSIRLQSLYNRKADLVLPVSFDSVDPITFDICNNSRHILFVGSDFPPNVEALNFLASEVMPFTNRKLVVIGKGLEKYRKQFESDKIEIIGFVQDLKPYYEKSNFVVTPIFSGAGMKVKVAEALNFGKVVIGTSFSFIGYENPNINTSFLIKAETANDYIQFLSLDYPHYSVSAREYFTKYFSSDSMDSKLFDFFSDLKS